MSVRVALGRLYARETRRFFRPGRQSVSEGGALYSAAQILRDRRRRKPLVICASEPEGDVLFRALRENDLFWSVFVLPSSRPDVEYAETAGRLYKAEGCDCVVALGGEAVMNIAKAAVAWVAKPGVFKGTRVYRRLLVPVTPMVFAIPTQPCADMSLSEATIYGGDGIFRTVAGRALTPSVVLLDPVLLEHTSREDLAALGFDGLCRAVEAYIAPGKGDPEALAMAARAVRGFLENLEPCWNDGGTPAQRSGLMEAARKAGLAGSALGYGHVRNMCRGLCDAGIDGGEAYAVMLPFVLEKYGNSITEKLSRLCSLSGVMNTGGQRERAAALITRIRNMAFRMGLPEYLPEVAEPVLGEIAFRTATDIHSLPPVRWNEEKCRRILEISANSDKESSNEHF